MITYFTIIGIIIFLLGIYFMGKKLSNFFCDYNEENLFVIAYFGILSWGIILIIGVFCAMIYHFIKLFCLMYI